MPLPTLAQLVGPKGQDGAVVGFGVPMDAREGKASLELPMERGGYGLATLDRVTVLKMLVVSKEEAGFDPDIAARQMTGELSEETIARLQSTWTLLQLTVESHDPAVAPTVSFMLDIARRAGQLTHGLVGDPLARRYLLPEQVPVVIDKIPADAAVSINPRKTPEGISVCTLGMSKFGLPEFEISGVGESMQGAAAELLLSAAQHVLDNGPVDVGDELGAKGASFQVTHGGLDRGYWEGVACYDLVSVEGETDEALQAWNEHDRDRS